MAPFGDLVKGVVTYLAGTAAFTEDFAKHNVEPVIGDAVTAVKDFNLEKVAPAFEHGTNALKEYSQEKIAPALTQILDQANKALDGFRQQHVDPALLLTGDALSEFNEKHLGPAMGVTIATANDLGEKILVPGVYVTAATLKQLNEKQLAPILASAGVTLDEFGREKLGPALEEAGKWIQKHPGETAVIAGAGVILVFPGLVTTPTLWVLGFGSEGVGAGSAAALAHSYIGNVAARSAFATLQSAGAGGYGVVIVDGFASAGALTVGALKIFDSVKAGKPPKAKL